MQKTKKAGKKEETKPVKPMEAEAIKLPDVRSVVNKLKRLEKRKPPRGHKLCTCKSHGCQIGPFHWCYCDRNKK